MCTGLAVVALISYLLTVIDSGCIGTMVPNLFHGHGLVNVCHYSCDLGRERRKFIAPCEFYGVYAFAMVLSSAPVIDMANRKVVFCAVRYQLIYGPAPILGLVFKDLCIRREVGEAPWKSLIAVPTHPIS